MGCEMNKLAVVTRANGKVKDITDMTFPMLKKYAAKCSAEFIVLSHIHPVHYHYRVLRCKELLNEYDRLLLIDYDTFIRKDCPVLFDIVPSDMIGCVYEDKGTRQVHRRNLIRQVQEKYGNVNWRSGYINDGVFVVSKMHQGIFEPIHEKYYWLDFGQDDVVLGYNIKKYGFKIFELPYLYNHMSLFSEEWHGGKSRFDSYILHYAGSADFLDRGNLTRLELIKKDFQEHQDLWI